MFLERGRPETTDDPTDRAASWTALGRPVPGASYADWLGSVTLSASVTAMLLALNQAPWWLASPATLGILGCRR